MPRDLFEDNQGGSKQAAGLTLPKTLVTPAAAATGARDLFAGEGKPEEPAEEPSPVKALGSEIARGFTAGASGLLERGVEAAKYVGEKTGLEGALESIGVSKGSTVFSPAAKALGESAEKYGRKAKAYGAGPVTEF